GLRAIGYARVVVTQDEIVYFERELVSEQQPQLFRPEDFRWTWSVQKQAVKKEQLSAFHGVNVAEGQKWFAWHGLGENQLHFSGERNWWPAQDDPHGVTFPFPTRKDKIDLDQFMELLSGLDEPAT